MNSPRDIMDTMKVYNCSAVEAIQFLNSPCTNHFLFSSGQVYYATAINDLILTLIP